MQNPLEHLDDIIHVKARLGIMSILIAYGKSDFTFLKKKLDLSDGNLGSHIRKLEEVGYIEVQKSFIARKPKTVCQATETGIATYQRHIKALESMIYSFRQEEEGEQ